jgi:hypothetical protein
MLQSCEAPLTGYPPILERAQPAGLSGIIKGLPMSLTVKLFTILALSAVSSNLSAFGKASNVVVIVWDGMRPDFVSEETTPTLTRLARQGVTRSGIITRSISAQQK